MSAVGPTTHAATSACVAASVISSRMAVWSRSSSGRRQAMRTSCGGASPSRKQQPLRNAISAETRVAGDSVSPPAAASTIASVIVAVASARNCMRRRATVG
jgi:hypothetical protein